MKKFLYAALAVATIAFVGCKPTNTPDDQPGGGNDTVPVTPPATGDQPVVEATEGAVTVVWNTVDFTPCVDNQLVFAGDYNGYNVDPANLVHFEAIEGYAGWYKAVITPADPAASPVLQGKPCALYLDGTFPSSWDHQWIGTAEHPCELIDGPAKLEVEYEVESKLVVSENSSVVYVRSYSFKTDPCKAPETYTVNFKVTCPDLGEGNVLYVCGKFNGWDATATPLTLANGIWTCTVDGVVMGDEYKFLANASWDNEELAAVAEGADCAEAVGNRKVDDVDIVAVVENIRGITATRCEAAAGE